MNLRTHAWFLTEAANIFAFPKEAAKELADVLSVTLRRIRKKMRVALTGLSPLSLSLRHLEDSAWRMQQKPLPPFREKVSLRI